jgi:endonuclease/exonuclease/phosphatase (EEP) superfamily protein YafD
MRIRRALSALTDPIGMTLGLLILVPGLLLLLAPRLGLGRAPVFAVVLALRQPLTGGLSGVAMVVILLSVVRGARPYLLPAAVVLTLIALVSGITLVSRGLSVGPSPESSAGQVRILSWNINGDLVVPAVIAGLAARERADILVIPDANVGHAAGELKNGFTDVGYPMTLFAPAGSSAELAVFVRPDLADDYRAPEPGPYPDKTLVLRPTTPDVPLLVALHAPQPGVRSTGPWSSTLAWVEQQCTTRTAVAVGDFNGTVDNFGGPGLGGCHDAAVATGSGAVSTWPTSMPAWLGMPIDHVLAADGWTTTGFSVITDHDSAGARHRPILAVLRKSG